MAAEGADEGKRVVLRINIKGEDDFCHGAGGKQAAPRMATAKTRAVRFLRRFQQAGAGRIYCFSHAMSGVLLMRSFGT
jgi:hypothetical protein